MSYFSEQPLEYPEKYAIEKLVEAIESDEHLSAGQLLEITKTGTPNKCFDSFKITMQITAHVPNETSAIDEDSETGLPYPTKLIDKEKERVISIVAESLLESPVMLKALKSAIKRLAQNKELPT